jgi:superfamily II DNA/RNA helicase
MSFADLGVTNAVAGALARRGIKEPFAIQRLVIGDVLAGRDVLAKSPTGSGKTLAFGVPLVDAIEADAPRPAALILAPTRELATQIVDALYDIAHARALRVSAVYGGVSLTKQARDAARSHIVVATPGRLEDLLGRRAFRLDAVQVLVLDEADRMLDMGFRPAVDRIVAQCPADRQTLFFSATLDGEAGRIAAAYTSDPVRREHAPAPRKPEKEVEHRFVHVERPGRIDALVAELERDRDLALVFVRTKRGADRLVKRLKAEGVAALAMHGDKSQRQREKALAQFEAGHVDVLVATDVAARGIDVAGISHVINFDAPPDRDAYVHRVGRTGRAGRSGVGITFVGGEEHRHVSRFADELTAGRRHAPAPARRRSRNRRRAAR